MKNETLDVINSRRSIRAYKSDAIPRELLDAVLEAGTSAPTGMGRQSPVIILVLADSSRPTYVEDASCVLENMMLAAHSLGLGTVWVHREREIFDSENGKRLLAEWKLPESLRGVGSIAIGYPAVEPDARLPRKDGYIIHV